MKMNKHPLARAIAAAAAAVAVTVPAAAEDKSWLCKNFPSTCASEDNPGGLPGHSSGAAGSSETMTRGLSDDAEAPATAASPASPTTPAPAPEAAPPAAPDDKSPAP